MTLWEETLHKFTKFGGLAENVKLGTGKFGRGIFAIDQKKLVKLQVPKQLLVPVDWLELDDFGRPILTSECDWDIEKKEFYLEYLHNYGLNDELIKELMGKQLALFNIPIQIKEMLLNYGVDKDFCCEPSFKAALATFKHSRRINIKDKLYLMPVVELVNHSASAKYGFTHLPYVGMAGKFKDEILVNYSVNYDALDFYRVYGFSEIRPYSFSGSSRLNIGSVTLNIARSWNIYQEVGKVRAPKLQFNGQVIDLSFLLLANTKHKSSPKIIFNQLMQQVSMPKKIGE